MTYVTVRDTIRLNAAFEDFSGIGADPLTTTLYIYDEGRNTLISGTTTGGVTNGSTTGKFYYDYTTVNEGLHFYEFIGSVSGKNISDRGTFYVTWA